MASSNDKGKVLERLMEVIVDLIKTTRSEKTIITVENARTMDLFTDLGFDSVEALDLLSLIEAEFSVSIDVSQIAGKRKIGEFESLIAERLSEGVK